MLFSLSLNDRGTAFRIIFDTYKMLVFRGKKLTLKCRQVNIDMNSREFIVEKCEKQAFSRNIATLLSIFFVNFQSALMIAKIGIY